MPFIHLVTLSHCFFVVVASLCFSFSARQCTDSPSLVALLARLHGGGAHAVVAAWSHVLAPIVDVGAALAEAADAEAGAAAAYR